MKNKLIILIILTCLGLNLYAQDSFAKLVSVKGSVTYNDREFNVGDVIPRKGKIKTGPHSYIKLSLINYKTTVLLGPHSELILWPAQGKKEQKILKFFLINGNGRWISNAQSKNLVIVEGKRAYAGGKGSDFFVTNSLLFDEMELIVAEGRMLFRSLFNSKNQKTVKKSQWSGTGGRFGNTIKEPIILEPKVMKHYLKFQL